MDLATLNKYFAESMARQKAADGKPGEKLMEPPDPAFVQEQVDRFMGIVPEVSVLDVEKEFDRIESSGTQKLDSSTYRGLANMAMLGKIKAEYEASQLVDSQGNIPQYHQQVIAGWTRMLDQADQWSMESSDDGQPAVSTGVGNDSIIPAEMMEQDTEFARVVGDLLQIIPPSDDDSQPRSTLAMPDPQIPEATIGPTPEGIEVPATEDELNRGLINFGEAGSQSELHPSYGQVFGQSSRAFVENLKNVINYAGTQTAAFLIGRQKGLSLQETRDLADKIYDAGGGDKTEQQEDLGEMLKSASPLKRSLATAVQIIPELGPVDALEAMKAVNQSGDVRQVLQDYLVQAFGPISKAMTGDTEDMMSDPLAGMVGPIMVVMAGSLLKGGGKQGKIVKHLDGDAAKKLDDIVEGKITKSEKSMKKEKLESGDGRILDEDINGEATAKKKSSDESRQPWEMTREEYIQEQRNKGRVDGETIPLGRRAGDEHENAVYKALRDGEKVPGPMAKKVVSDEITSKQPWEMSRKEYEDYINVNDVGEQRRRKALMYAALPDKYKNKLKAADLDKYRHKYFVNKAVNDGLDVPAAVIAEYKNKGGGAKKGLSEADKRQLEKAGVVKPRRVFSGKGKTAIEAVDEAVSKQIIDEGTASIARHLLKTDPDFDKNSIVSFSDTIKKASRDVIERENLDPDGEYVTVGETISKLEDDIIQTTIKIRKGADADTLVEEWYHRGYNRLSPEDQKLYNDYHTKIKDVRPVDEAFAKDGRDFFFSNKLHEEAGPVGTLFERARDSLKDLLKRIRRVRGMKIPKEITDLYQDIGTGAYERRPFTRSAPIPTGEARSTQLRELAGGPESRGEKGPVMHDEVVRHKEEAQETADLHITDYQLKKEAGPGAARRFRAVAGAEDLKDIGNLSIHWRDFWRNTRKVFGDKADREVLIPLENAKRRYVEMQDKLINEYNEVIEKKLGIRAKSREDTAVMAFGELRITKEQLIERFGEKKAKEIINNGIKKNFEDSELKISNENELIKQFGKKESRNHISEAITEAIGYEKAGRVMRESLIKEFGEKKAADIIEAAQWYRGKYDLLLDEVNEVRAKIYPNRLDKQIPKRRNYFRHYQDLEGFQGLANLFDTPAGIPADLAGISEFTKPKSKFQSFMQSRHGSDSMQSAAGGFANYIRAAAYTITMDPQISNLRAFYADIVKQTGPAKMTAEEILAVKRRVAREEGIKLIERRQKDGTTVYAAEKGKGEILSQKVIAQVKMIEKGRPYAEGSNNLNKYLKHTNHFINDLAGKSNPADRWFQENIGRKAFGVMDWLNKRVKTNTILGNASSAVAQAFNIPQAIGEFKQYAIPGMQDTMAQIFKKWTKKTYPIDKSAFIKERYFDSSYNKFQTSWLLSKVGVNVRPRIKQTAAWYLNAVDEISTRFMWNSFYRKAIAENIKDPIRWSDQMTKDMVGGRGIGEVPIAQKSKVIQIVAPFQLEVGNAWWVLQDQMTQKKFGAIATSMLASYIMNRAAEEVRGNPVSFDPIDAIIEGMRELDDPTTDTFEKILRAGGRIGGEVLSNVPLGQTAAAMYPKYVFMLAGRQMPSRKALFGRNDPTRFGSGLLVAKGMTDPVYKVLPPFGGIQAKKTVEGVESLVKGKVDSRSGKSTLFEVDRNIENGFKSVLFGKWSTPTARAYFEGKRTRQKRSDYRKHIIKIWADGKKEDAYTLINEWNNEHPDDKFDKKKLYSAVKSEIKKRKDK